MCEQKKNAELGNIDNARTPEQIAHMEKTVGNGKCPFCDNNGFDPKLNVVIWKGQYWRAWFNPFPYSGTNSHIIIATINHITGLKELPPQALAEWAFAIKHLIEEYQLLGGGIVTRFGDNELNGGTLTHMHTHIQVPSKVGFCIAVFFKDERLKKFLDEASRHNQEAKGSIK